MARAKTSKERLNRLRESVKKKMSDKSLTQDDLRSEINQDYLHKDDRVSQNTIPNFLNGTEPRAELALALGEWAASTK